jgi:hypothetical protein
MREIFQTVDAMGCLALPDVVAEPFDELEGTSLLYADLPALRADVDGVRAGSRLPDEILTGWLLTAGSVLSEPNSTTFTANSEPRRSDRRKTGYRPPRYGRAAIFTVPMDGQGLSLVADVKGCGVASSQQPQRVQRGSGTLLLQEAIQELINARLLDIVFHRAGMDVRCLPVYGLVDLGMSGWCSYFSEPMPCVSMVRRGHLRDDGNLEMQASDSVEEMVKHRIELTLRRFGLSSAPQSCAIDFVCKDGELQMLKNGMRIECVTHDLIAHHLQVVGIEAPCNVRVNNVQLTKSCVADPIQATLVDFGHYTAEPDYFGHHLLTLVHDRPFNWGSFLRDSDPGWVRPDPDLMVNQALVGPVAYPRALATMLGYDRAVTRLRPGAELAATKLALRVRDNMLRPADLAVEIDEFVRRAMSPSGQEKAG